jgi:hypothetical protein
MLIVIMIPIRAVFIEMNTYNSHIDKWCLIQFLAEVPGVGGVVVSSDMKIFQLCRFSTSNPQFISISILIFCCGALVAMNIFAQLKNLQKAYLNASKDGDSLQFHIQQVNLSDSTTYIDQRPIGATLDMGLEVCLFFILLNAIYN